MPIEINGVKLYSPSETAELLGTNVGMVRYYRNRGYIEGTQMGPTNTYYTMEQIEKARPIIAQERKPGPKGRRKQSDEDRKEGRSSSVISAASGDFCPSSYVALGA